MKRSKPPFCAPVFQVGNDSVFSLKNTISALGMQRLQPYQLAAPTL